MIYFTKYESGYRLFQTTTMYNSKHIYLWFEVFFFSDAQFKTFTEFNRIDFRTDASIFYGCLGCLDYTKEQKRQIDERAQKHKAELIEWYMRVGDLTQKTEYYNGNEFLIRNLMRPEPRFYYYAHYSRRNKSVVAFKEERPSGVRLKDQKKKCSKSTKHLRIKSILKQIWDDELEVDIAYKMLVES